MMSQGLDNYNSVSYAALLGPAFYPVYWKIEDGEADEIYLKGGRGSLKSSFAALTIVRGMMADPDANGIAFRKVADTLRTSVLASIEWAIDQLKVGHYWRITYSPAEATYLPTGQKVIFKGLDKAGKIKSIRLKKGFFKYLWFEELPEFDGPEEIRSVRQSVLRGGDGQIVLYSMNPPRDPKHWANVEAAQEKKKKLVHHSSYEQAPPEWLGSKFLEDAAWMKENNPFLWSHEYGGVPTGLDESVIFGKKYRVADFTPRPDWSGPYFGADWGFSEDPSTLTKSWIEHLPDGRMNLYIEYAAFGYHVEMDDYPTFYAQVPDSQRYPIYADNSRPETISHVKNKGFIVEAAEKWKGSVEDGIATLLSFTNIVIHPRCPEMIDEARLYSYKIDRVTKDILPDIVDRHNHGWDAIRYSLYKYIAREISILEVL